MRHSVLPLLRGAVLALASASASAQLITTVNDTRDLPDHDLADGVIDADSALVGEQRTLRATLEHIGAYGGAWRVILPAQTLVLTRWGADEACHWGDLDIFGAGLSFLSIEGVSGASALDASGFGTSPATADRIFDVQPSVPQAAALAIKDVRLVFGSRPGANFAGGAIQHRSPATLELQNVDIAQCDSGNGGGLYASGPLTMQGGSIAQCSASIDGGAAHFAGGSSATFTGADVQSNTAAQYGGGVFVAPGASFDASLVQISNNSATEGGGVRTRGAASLLDCALIGNIANGGTGSGGNLSLRSSGAPLPSTLLVDRCVIGAGSASAGAGLYIGLSTTALVLRSSFELNIASTLGGGLSNFGSCSVYDSTFSDNHADSGGGVHNFRQLALRNCTFSANRAAQNGGGLNLSGLNGDRCTLDACTVVGNQAAVGGGVHREGAFGAPLAEIKNTFLAANRSTLTGTWQNSAGTYPFSSHGFNVDTDGTCGLGAGNYSGSVGAPLYAGLGPLQFNGGPTRTHALLYCSAANCRADGAHIDGTSNAFDQRGVLRDSPPDVGAFDAPAVTLAPYCTPGTTTSGCQASISASGMFSSGGPCNLELHVANVEGQRQGLIFYGVSGPQAAPWGGGSTSWLCVKAPTQRTGTQNSGGVAGACNGSFQLSFGVWILAHPGALGSPFPLGGSIWAQAWFRDPPAPKTTNLSDAIELPICP
jgi:hypothetical protein